MEQVSSVVRPLWAAAAEGRNATAVPTSPRRPRTPRCRPGSLTRGLAGRGVVMRIHRSKAVAGTGHCSEPALQAGATSFLLPSCTFSGPRSQGPPWSPALARPPFSPQPLAGFWGLWLLPGPGQPTRPRPRPPAAQPPPPPPSPSRDFSAPQGAGSEARNRAEAWSAHPGCRPAPHWKEKQAAARPRSGSLRGSPPPSRPSPGPSPRPPFPASFPPPEPSPGRTPAVLCASTPSFTLLPGTQIPLPSSAAARPPPPGLGSGRAEAALWVRVSLRPSASDPAAPTPVCR